MHARMADMMYDLFGDVRSFFVLYGLFLWKKLEPLL